VYLNLSYRNNNQLYNCKKFFSEEDGLQKARKVIENFTMAFIDFQKPLIAVCNGPAIGIACTTLTLCDIVWARVDNNVEKLGC
jgi:peroxisomal 3,2-trans-enoyl-CoA isomerase